MCPGQQFPSLLLTHSHPCLQTPSQQVTDLPGSRVSQLIQHMHDCILNLDTVKETGKLAGLAAPQIGINERIVFCSFNRQIESLTPMINPSYCPLSDEKVEAWEMCLSAPLNAAKISRYKKINLTYQDTQGILHGVELNDFAARVVQHEVDHLDGILILERAKETKNFTNKNEAFVFLQHVRAQHGH